MSGGPRAVGELIVNAVPALRDRLVEVQIGGAWSDLVGPDAARRSRPIGLTGGCLHVAVDNSPWLQELTLRAGELTRKIAARFPPVRALRLTLGPATNRAPEASSPAASPRATALSPHDLREIDAAVAAIPDPDARAAARRLLGTARRSSLHRGVV